MIEPRNQTNFYSNLSAQDDQFCVRHALGINICWTQLIWHDPAWTHRTPFLTIFGQHDNPESPWCTSKLASLIFYLNCTQVRHRGSMPFMSWSHGAVSRLQTAQKKLENWRQKFQRWSCKKNKAAWSQQTYDGTRLWFAAFKGAIHLVSQVCSPLSTSAIASGLPWQRSQNMEWNGKKRSGCFAASVQSVP